MNSSRSTYYSQLYREFRSIEATEWRTVIRFYQEYKDKLKELDFAEYFEMLLAYSEALFEIGAYEQYLEAADKVIEESMVNNIKFFNGVDVLQNALFKKAASFFHTEQLEQSDYILRELLRIDPYDNDAVMFLKKCLRKMNSNILKKSKAASIFLIFMSALIICLEMLVVRNFYPIYTDLIEATRNSTLVLSVAAIFGGEVYHRLRTNREVDNFVEHLQRRKK